MYIFLNKRIIYHKLNYQLSSGSVCHAQSLSDFLVMVIQFVLYIYIFLFRFHALSKFRDFFFIIAFYDTDYVYLYLYIFGIVLFLRRRRTKFSLTFSNRFLILFALDGHFLMRVEATYSIKECLTL